MDLCAMPRTPRTFARGGQSPAMLCFPLWVVCALTHIADRGRLGGRCREFVDDTSTNSRSLALFRREVRMETRLTLAPGQNGTKKLLATYGDRLVCVLVCGRCHARRSTSC